LLNPQRQPPYNDFGYAMKTEIPAIDVQPVLDGRGFVVLFDLWIDREWVGSSRTARQCELLLSHLLGVEIEATYSTAW
jgi:hypothetical protein